MSIPQYMKKWINIKTHFAEHTKSNPKGMAAMLSYLKLELEGKHHSGIADCHNILKIVIHLQNKYDVTWKDPSQENTFMPGDWICHQCNDHNFNRNATCRQCGAQRVEGTSSMASKPVIEAKPGDWACNCGFNNFARNVSCKKCGVSKKIGVGSTANFASSSAGGPPKKPGDWLCLCGFNNFGRNVNCKRCNTTRP